MAKYCYKNKIVFVLTNKNQYNETSYIFFFIIKLIMKGNKKNFNIRKKKIK